jgi:hypothetical protein
LSQLASAQNRYLFLRCQAESNKPELAHVKVRYLDEINDGAEQVVSGTATAHYTNNRKQWEDSVRPEIAAQKELFVTAIAKQEALACADAGRYEQAAEKLDRQVKALDAKCASAPAPLQIELREEIDNLRQRSDEFRKNQYSAGTRKSLQNEAWTTGNSKSEVIMKQRSNTHVEDTTPQGQLEQAAIGKRVVSAKVSLSILASLLLVAAATRLISADKASQSYVAHEWGTFTSVQAVMESCWNGNRWKHHFYQICLQLDKSWRRPSARFDEKHHGQLATNGNSSDLFLFGQSTNGGRLSSISSRCHYRVVSTSLRDFPGHIATAGGLCEKC